jgi:phosphotransferase system IIB component
MLSIGRKILIGGQKENIVEVDECRKRVIGIMADPFQARIFTLERETSK